MRMVYLQREAYYGMVDTNLIGCIFGTNTLLENKLEVEELIPRVLLDNIMHLWYRRDLGRDEKKAPRPNRSVHCKMTTI